MEEYRKSVLAGVCIGLGGYAFLRVGGGVLGAVLFSFGLLSVVNFGLNLYTGKACYMDSLRGLAWLFGVVLVGNVIGCALMSLVPTSEDAVKACEAVVKTRLENGWLIDGVLGIPCGMIMYVAVRCGLNGRFLPLLIGIPLFILCGFFHSIADAYYYSTYIYNVTFDWHIVTCWVATATGNFIGCNIVFRKGIGGTHDFTEVGFV